MRVALQPLKSKLMYGGRSCDGTSTTSSVPAVFRVSNPWPFTWHVFLSYVLFPMMLCDLFCSNLFFVYSENISF